MNNKTKGILCLIAAFSFWGVAAPIVKLGLKEIAPFTFVFWRMFLSVLIMTPVLWPKISKLKIKIHDWPVIIFSGLLGITLNIGLYFLGLSYTTVIDSSIISSTTSIFTAIAAYIFLREKISRIVAVGIVVSFAGTLVIIIQPILENGLFLLNNIFGNILILLAVWSWVAYTIFNKEIVKKYDTMILLFFSFFTGAVCFLPFAAKDIFNIDFYVNMSNFSLFAIIFETLIATIGAYFLFNLGIKYVTATTAGVIAYLHPIISICASVIFLGEKMTVPFIAGAFLVFIGLFLSEAKHSIHPLHHLHKYNH